MIIMKIGHCFREECSVFGLALFLCLHKTKRLRGGEGATETG
nr:MAG TPA: hypothetical protein [Caudoviricetes sp.]